jgi:hypothetical protein
MLSIFGVTFVLYFVKILSGSNKIFLNILINLNLITNVEIKLDCYADYKIKWFWSCSSERQRQASNLFLYRTAGPINVLTS